MAFVALTESLYGMIEEPPIYTDLTNHHHALADAEVCAVIAIIILQADTPIKK